MLFIDETKRSDLPDSEFGIPEDRKFPLDTAEHVHSAIKLFGHAEESKRKSLAKRIASKAKSYGIEIPETSQVYKYLHENSNMTADQVDAFYTELKKRLAEDDEVITESAILESSKNNYKKIYDITIKMFKDSGRLPNADNGELKQFLATGKTDEFGGALCIAGLGTGFEATCGKINKEIKPLGGRIYADNYGCAFLSIKEDAILTDEENNNDLDLPDGVQDDATSLVELLDSVDPKHIYLSSDWHISKNHYTHEKNAVNTSEIVSWCKEHIKDDDIFMYLGDMTYRWANDEDKENAKKIFKSLPGIKILIIGNHDEFSDGGNYEEYGFKYAVKELHYKNIIFSHRPIDMCDKPGYLDIHGHKHHKDTDYHSMDGSANVNVYPSFHNNKPITLDRAIKHKDYYMRNNKRSDRSGMGESTNIKMMGKVCIQNPGASTAAPNCRIQDNTNRLAIASGSSRRFKHNISPVYNADLDPHKLYNIGVCQYKYNLNYLEADDQRYNQDVIGFIAEDIYEKYPVAADIGVFGQVNDWNLRFIVPPMLQLIQEQHKEIEILKSSLVMLNGEVSILKQKMEVVK